MSVGDFLVAYLRRAGVREIFGIPGDLVLRLFSQLEGRRQKMITFSHEPAVGFAADGYARATGAIGVACVTYGAGGNNMVNSIAGAYAEHVPVLVISGGPGEQEYKHGTLIHHQARAIDSQLRIYREVTAAAEALDDPRTAAETIDRVVRTMWREQRPGYLEIARDLVDQKIPVPTDIRRAGTPLVEEHSDGDRVREAARDVAERLNRARKPLIFVGLEAFRFKTQGEVLKLCERIGAPILTPMLAKGAVPMDHPLYMGVIGTHSPAPVLRRLREADLVVELGCMETDLGAFPHASQRERSIRAIDKRVDVSQHSYTDVTLRDFVHALLGEKLSRHREKVTFHDNLPAPPAWLREGGKSGAPARSPVKVAEVLHTVNHFLAGRDDFVVVAEAGDMLFAGVDVRVGGRAAYFAQGLYASMGFAIPGSMGIEIGTGKRPLVLCGDGAFQMTGPEISHAPVHGLRPIVLVINNGGWGIFRPVVARQKILEVPDWPYAEMARLWGGRGDRVETGPELLAALERAEKSPEFSLIEVMIGRNDLSPLSRKYIRASSRK
jgi:indolepyruvate decarboxylase